MARLRPASAFGFAVRDLMVRDGTTARQVGRRGDQAAATPPGALWVIRV
jgi:hypothetical protein